MQIIDRSGYTVGRISGFGSVIVNGVRFDTSSASIFVDDRLAAEADLAVGQIVSIDGVVDGDQGVAETLSTDPQLRGPVSMIDASRGQLEILDTLIQITTDTRWDAGISPASISTLRTGDQLEVYGFRTVSSGIRATYLLRSQDLELEAQGIVQMLDRGSSQFAIDGLVVDYTGAFLTGFDGSQIDNGDLVEVEGSVLNPDGFIVADRVERETEAAFSAGPEGTEVELEGIITEAESGGVFALGQTVVVVGSSTVIQGGTTADLEVDRLVEVEGLVNGAGQLVADSIEFRVDSEYEIEAIVESVDANAVTVLGLVLRESNTTQFADESDQSLQDFGLADVVPGDFVKAKAFASGDTLILNLLKRKNPEDRLKIQGPLTQVLANELQIRSAVIAVDQSAEYEVNDQPVSQVEFFALLSPGVVVEAAGQSFESGVLLAEELELEE
ncbi:MAG: DUF5666 domain-containing protein [Pseudomonadales bacterium]